MAMTIACADMGYSCGYEVTGEDLGQILSGVKHHSLEFHGYTEKELEEVDAVEQWKGAIRQASRPGASRTPRDESDRDVIPH